MTTLACGTCGVSIWSMAFPPFHAWVMLLPLAFLVYHFAAWRNGTFSFGKLIMQGIIAFGAFIAAAAMLAALVIPLAFFVAILGLLKQLALKDKAARILTGGVLLCFVASAGWNFQQAKAQGKFWKMSRFQAGSPGMSFVASAVKEKLFSDVELIELLKSDEPTVVKNTTNIVERKLELNPTDNPADDRAGLESFAREIKALNESGEVQFEPRVREAYGYILQPKEDSSQES